MGFFVLVLTVYVFGNWLLVLLRKPTSLSGDSLHRCRERLVNPRWNELEHYFGQPIPEPIKNLYAQTELLGNQDISLHGDRREWHIAQFLPADIETLDQTMPDLKKSKAFPFATDSFGDCYYVPLSDDESDKCVVRLYHHDGNDNELVSNSLAAFVEAHKKDKPS